MLKLNKKQGVLLVSVLVFVVLPGCTNWRHKYEGLYVENENSKGQLQKSRSDMQGLSNRISADQRTIEELTRQIEELNRTPGEASGFGNLPTAFNANTGQITVTLDNAILFSSGKATLKGGTRELDLVISTIKSNYSGKMIEVVGHTDTDPIKKSGWKDNWELSAARALSVVRYLAKQGLPSSKLTAGGAGSARPVAPNSSSAGKAKNRRVEIVVNLLK